MTAISNGLRPEVWKGAAWSAADLRAVLRTIVSSPHAAVPVADLVAMLGAGGAEKLASMNQKDLLVLRAFDPVARDIDAAAFGPGLDEDVYTLPSAAHVLAARIELDMKRCPDASDCQLRCCAALQARAACMRTTRSVAWWRREQHGRTRRSN